MIIFLSSIALFFIAYFSYLFYEYCKARAEYRKAGTFGTRKVFRKVMSYTKYNELSEEQKRSFISEKNLLIPRDKFHEIESLYKLFNWRASGYTNNVTKNTIFFKISLTLFNLSFNPFFNFNYVNNKINKNKDESFVRIDQSSFYDIIERSRLPPEPIDDKHFDLLDQVESMFNATLKDSFVITEKA